MSTLLLRFAAPLQSWGNDSKYDTRRTQREPTKSGVIGVLASALGRRRDADLSDLTMLHFAVRTDRQGQLLRDYQIVKSEKSNYVTNRYYLSDAVFLIGLESNNREFLELLGEALCNPMYPLFLGRRSCPPEGRLYLDIVEDDLRTAMNHYPLLVKESDISYPIQIMIDSDNAEAGTLVEDCPISFSPIQRIFAYRLVEKYFLAEISGVEHDPMKELR